MIYILSIKFKQFDMNVVYVYFFFNNEVHETFLWYDKDSGKLMIKPMKKIPKSVANFIKEMIECSTFSK